MDLRVVAALAGLLGGACWVVRWVADPVAALYWVGLGLVGVALAGVGTGLVSRGALWLRAIVAVAFPLLVWSVYSVVKGDGEARTLDGVLGVLAILGAVLVAVRARAARPDGEQPRRRHGSHSAR